MMLILFLCFSTGRGEGGGYDGPGREGGFREARDNNGQYDRSNSRGGMTRGASRGGSRGGGGGRMGGPSGGRGAPQDGNGM
jgi:hypothetical protein